MQVGQAGQKNRQARTPTTNSRRNSKRQAQKKRLRPYGALVRLLLYRVTKGTVRG